LNASPARGDDDIIALGLSTDLFVKAGTMKVDEMPDGA
jgi:hypothetical protein